MTNPSFKLFSVAGLAASQWLSLHLQMLGVAMVTCVSFIAVLEHHFSSVDPGGCFIKPTKLTLFTLDSSISSKLFFLEVQ
jgi:hypothetical protein